MDFNYSPRQVRYDSLKMNFDYTNTSYCDSNGHLLFYTNGIYIANALDKKIENSDSLNAGAVQYVWNPYIQEYGYRKYQAIITLPVAAGKHILLHTFMDTFWNSTLYCKKLYATYLGMDANSGLGQVEYKNQPIIDNDTLAWEMSATRHANGHDWWTLIQKRNTNCYYRVLVNESGAHLLPALNCLSTTTIFGSIGATCFSPDGSKFIYLGVYGGVNIFDFDRCSGEISNPVFIPIPVFQDSTWIGNGVAISPNNRFLYVGATRYVFQYDLWATDIAASIDTVAVYDGFKSPFGSFFNTMQLAPDGKIYESCGNAEKVYHVIENPDRKGDSCNFVQHGIHLPTFSWGVPNFPNYRLGALPGSPCDTLTGLNETARAEKEKLLKVFPNPTTDYITVDYGFTDWNKGEATLEITNQLGQVVHRQPLPMYSGFQKVEVSQLTTGVYTAFIKRGVQVVATAKFVRE